MREYDQIVPGAAERILQMAERQQIHRHKIEEQKVEDASKLQRDGQYFAIAISTITIVGSFTITAMGYSTQGIVGVVSSLAILASLFIYKNRDSNKRPNTERTK